VASSYALTFREGVAKRWIGVRAGWAMEPGNPHFGVPTLLERWKATPLVALSRVVGGLRAVGEPGHVGSPHAREPGDPMLARRPDQWAGRPGNTEVVSLG
jgi:hypothetical protein